MNKHYIKKMKKSTVNKNLIRSIGFLVLFILAMYFKPEIIVKATAGLYCIYKMFVYFLHYVNETVHLETEKNKL